MVSDKSQKATQIVLLIRNNKQQTIEELSKGLGCSRSHVEDLCRSLRDSGIIVSTRGRGGGYRLCKEPGDITFFEIIEAVNGKSKKMEESMGILQTLVEQAFKNINMEK